MRLLVWLTTATVFTLSAPASASADVLVGFSQFSLGTAKFTGELGNEFDRTKIDFQFGGGLRYRSLALTLSVGIGPVDTHDKSRHSSESFGFRLGPDIRYYLTKTGGFEPYIRTGLHRNWIEGSGTVRRYCAESNTCTGGFWTAEPDYAGWNLRAGVGVQYTVTERDFYAGFWLDVGYDAITMKVVEKYPPGGVISISLGASIGGGRTR